MRKQISPHPHPFWTLFQLNQGTLTIAGLQEEREIFEEGLQVWWPELPFVDASFTQASNNLNIPSLNPVEKLSGR